MTHRDTMTRREERMERDQLADYVLTLEQRLLDVGRKVIAAERARIRKELEKEVAENKQDMIEGEPVEDEWLRVGLLLAALDRICPKEPSDG